MLHLLGPTWAKCKAIYGGRAQAEEHKGQLHLAAANDAAEACGASKFARVKCLLTCAGHAAADQGAKAPEGPGKSRRAARGAESAAQSDKELAAEIVYTAINGPFKPVAIAKAHATSASH
ncbi:TPA: hypothetical protein ACH3X1_015696 [Trebouxia sp. C0004]